MAHGEVDHLFAHGEGAIANHPNDFSVELSTHLENGLDRTGLRTLEALQDFDLGEGDDAVVFSHHFLPADHCVDDDVGTMRHLVERVDDDNRCRGVA